MRPLRKYYDDCLERQTKGGDIPPPCLPKPTNHKEGLLNIRKRVASLGMNLNDFIDAYLPICHSTFYTHIRKGKLRYINIVIIGKVLRLNPQDYMYLKVDINEAVAKNRIYRRIRKDTIWTADISGLEDLMSEIEENDI